MDIPAQVTVGKHTYSVEQPRLMYRYGCKGACDYTNKTITIATHSSRTGKRFDTEDVDATFWHEVTHAILFDMKSPLYKNERFVESFSRRLTKAIHSAKFTHV